MLQSLQCSRLTEPPQNSSAWLNTQRLVTLWPTNKHRCPRFNCIPPCHGINDCNWLSPAEIRSHSRRTLLWVTVMRGRKTA
jgi:hypothetical protein